MMWLLDVNLDVKIKDFLVTQNIVCKTSQEMSWSDLSNGKLVAVAVDAGFHVLLTRDNLFPESASRSLKLHPKFSIVLVKLPQQKSSLYMADFKFAWSQNPIQPKPGQLVIW